MLIVLCLTMSLAGCAGVRERVFGSGEGTAALPYRAKLTKGDDRRDFTVRVRAGGASVADVRESARHVATRYCLTTYGGSDAKWAMDARTRDWAYSRDGDDMIFNGRCVAR